MSALSVLRSVTAPRLSMVTTLPPRICASTSLWISFSLQATAQVTDADQLSPVKVNATLTATASAQMRAPSFAASNESVPPTCRVVLEISASTELWMMFLATEAPTVRPMEALFPEA